jgi:hypothetical protein
MCESEAPLPGAVFGGVWAITICQGTSGSSISEIK